MSLSREDIRNGVEVLSRPITNMCLFYSYYNLSEVEGLDEYSFDLMKQTDLLESAFRSYGVLTVTKELAHIDNKFEFHEFTKELSGRWGESYDALKESLTDYYGNSYAGGIAAYFLGSNAPVGLFRDEINSDQLDAFWTIDEELDMLERNKEYYKAAELIFSDDEYWWAEFGGEEWAIVCRFLQREDDVSDILWVDTGFGIEHNTANWLNDVGASDDERNMLWELDYNKGQHATKMKWNAFVYEELLPELLDDKRDGEFSRIYEIASQEDKSLRRFTF